MPFHPDLFLILSGYKFDINLDIRTWTGQQEKKGEGIRDGSLRPSRDDRKRTNDFFFSALGPRKKEQKQ